MVYKNITWSDQDSVDYLRLDQMAINDEIAKTLAIRNARGVLSFTNYTGASILVDSTTGEITATMAGGTEPSVVIDKARWTSLNFFCGRIVDPLPAAMYYPGPYPEPLFTLQHKISTSSVWTDFDDFLWMVAPNGGITVGGGATTQVAGAVSFSHVVQLPSGTYKFRVNATSQNSGTDFHLLSGGSADPIQFWVEDLGAISYV